jgi:hypothetical protein
MQAMARKKEPPPPSANEHATPGGAASLQLAVAGPVQTPIATPPPLLEGPRTPGSSPAESPEVVSVGELLSEHIHKLVEVQAQWQVGG